MLQRSDVGDSQASDASTLPIEEHLSRMKVITASPATATARIHEVSRKFRAATRGIISGSKSIAATYVWESLEGFAKAIDEIPKDVKVGKL